MKMKIRLYAIYIFFHLPDTEASAHACALEPQAVVLALVLAPAVVMTLVLVLAMVLVLVLDMVLVLAVALTLSLEVSPSSSVGRILVFSSCTVGCTSFMCLWRLLVEPARCEIFTLQILHRALVFSRSSKWVHMMLLLRRLTLSHIFQGRNEQDMSQPGP